MDQKKKRSWNIGLGLLFSLALLMGPGPGVYLINPGPGGIPGTFLGMPSVYAWAVGWFLVMSGIVWFGLSRVWISEDEEH
jgi:hypothetical protein